MAGDLDRRIERRAADVERHRIAPAFSNRDSNTA